jgi:hypothetical protein
MKVGGVAFLVCLKGHRTASVVKETKIVTRANNVKGGSFLNFIL